MSETTYPACSIKRHRRTGAEIDAVCRAIRDLLEESHPMTLRQLFYRLVSTGVIEKTEADYDNVVGRLAKEMRLRGDLPWDWMTDNTRWQRKTPRSSSLEETLEETATFYRRKIWDNQPEYVEIWSEKDAISGVILPVTNSWHVPLMVTRGYPSLSFMYESAQSMLVAGRRVHVGYLGDLDPSGVDIRRNVERRLREFGPGIDLDFQVLGVTRDQVSEYSLLTRPTKKSDSRSQNFSGESVEVDAIEPDELRRLVEEFIVHFVDQGRLAHLRLAEESERQILRALPAVARGMR